MIEMSEADVSLAKELMWRHGMTRKEAICYVASENGMSIRKLAMNEGVTEALMSKRVSGARRKMSRLMKDGEL